MLLSKCAICDTTKSRFIKKQEANGFLSSLGIKTLLSKIPLLGNVLFEYIYIRKAEHKKIINILTTSFE